MTTQVEAPPALEWLRATLEELRDLVKETQRQVVSVRMRVAALEEDVKLRDCREAELRAQLQEAESQLDESSASMRAAVKGDVLSDIEQLSARDKAMAACLVILAAKVVGAGQDSLARLGLSADVVATVRGLVFGFTGDSVPPLAFDSGNGMRYTPPPVTAQVAPPARNSVTFTQIPAEERELMEYRAEMIARVDNPNGILPRRASDRPTS